MNCVPFFHVLEQLAGVLRSARGTWTGGPPVVPLLSQGIYFFSRRPRARFAYDDVFPPFLIPGVDPSNTFVHA